MANDLTGGTVLLVDDDPAVGTVLEALLAQAGLEAVLARSGAEALAALERRPVDLVLTDLRMPGMDGMELLRTVTARWPDVPVLMLTAHGSVPVAVEAMKAGAADFVMKPFDREEILFAVRKALAGARPASEAAPRAQVPPGRGGMIGDGPAMRAVQELVDRAARGTATVLVRGESGTGKELVARAIHERSVRAAGPFVKIHCAALPDALLESELFGYEKGAFTGATARKPGRVELAQGGTLFLDEIGDVTPAVQVKLLRLLQDREFERLGGTQTLKADLRFVAATHRDLEAMIAKGEFREDLFYRLNVIPIVLPPLRARREDVVALARHFCAAVAEANGRGGVSLDEGALSRLAAQSWPGNVRQLQNFVERLVVLSDGAVLGVSDVERELGRPGLAGAAPAAAPPADAPSAPAPAPVAPAPAPAPPAADGGTLESRRREAERAALEEALRRANDNRTLAARLLGISRRTLYNKLAENGLS